MMTMGTCNADLGITNGAMMMGSDSNFKQPDALTRPGITLGTRINSVQPALSGIYRKFGQSLPLVESVAGTVEFSDVSPTVINGFLVTGDQRIRVRFESKARGPLPVLRRYLDSVMSRDVSALSVASVKAKVSGRAWVERDGIIVLLVRSFEMEFPKPILGV